VLGEGSGMVVLEELEHAKRRGAPIYAEVMGYGTTGDAFRVTDSHDEGRGAIACMKMALADSGLNPEQIGYINAHGTSTQVNDRTETLAIKKVFGDHARKLMISSTKSMTGHMLGAAGAVEAIATMLSVRDGIVPGSRNITTIDPEIKVDVATENREVTLTAALNDSFGFGGHNVALVFTA
jgi:3-oxoacyl-[acyl-carrier-protein] synthase II